MAEHEQIDPRAKTEATKELVRLGVGVGCMAGYGLFVVLPFLLLALAVLAVIVWLAWSIHWFLGFAVLSLIVLCGYGAVGGFQD